MSEVAYLQRRGDEIEIHEIASMVRNDVEAYPR